MYTTSMSKKKSLFFRHHSFIQTLTKQLHWPHQETTAHKILRMLHTSIIYSALILLGYILAQLQNLLG